MHPSILAKRKADAINRIVVAAGTLAEVHQLNPERRAALEPKGIKDLAALEMMRLEGLASLMEDLVAVTAVTKEQNQPVNKPAEDARPTLDDFPAHVVERSEPEAADEEPKKKSRRGAKK
jgi:hypothetical protein